jgi:hypothetical protein
MLEKNVPKRAKEEMDLWFSTLSHKDRRKLKMTCSTWGRRGGNIIAVGVRHGKAARRNKKLMRERVARLKAEHVAYEVRRSLPASIENA